MPWRLISFLFSLVLLLLFAGFNMNNSSNISFGFRELTDVPIFVSLLFSFILGVLFAIPFAYFGGKTSGSKKTKIEKEIKDKPVKKSKFFKGKKSEKNKPENNDTEIQPETDNTYN